MISYIIPFASNNKLERLNLLKATVDNIPEGGEICLVEMIPKWLLRIAQWLPDRTIWENKLQRKIKYIPFIYDGVFHRAGLMNYCVRKIATGDKLVLLEGDIIFPKELIEDIALYNEPIHCCSSVYFMNQEETLYYLLNKKLPKKMRTDDLKFTKPDGLAGGVVMVPKEIFMKIKGIPEMFEGTWGGDDNALWLKLIAFGFSYKTMPYKIYHLFHEHRTEFNGTIHKETLISIKNWDIIDWQRYNDSIGDDWGKNNIWEG